MNGGFYGLAFFAAINPKYLLVNLLLLDNRRARAMYIALLGTALTISITLGLVDVYVLKLGADLHTQKDVNAGLDIALGVILVVVGLLIATGRIKSRKKKDKSGRVSDWAQRSLREPRPLLAMGVGVIAGIPGGVYLAALSRLIDQDRSAAGNAVHVVLFNVIMFSLLLVPFLFLLIWPEGTKRSVRGLTSWSRGHARQLIAYAALIIGCYFLADGLIHVL